jgi:hypothetical protein
VDLTVKIGMMLHSRPAQVFWLTHFKNLSATPTDSFFTALGTHQSFPDSIISLEKHAV